jgi:plasmid stability protein
MTESNQEEAMATLDIKNFPEALYRRLQARAEREHRSLSQEVIYLLSRAVEEPEVRSLLELKGLGKELWRGIGPDRHLGGERSAWD